MHKKNTVEAIISKSYREIIQQHVFTLFNGINVILAIFVFFTGSYRNMLFMITVILNMLIGLFQEIRSKHMLDKLSLLNQAKIHVLKDNQEVEVYIQDVEEKDILVLHAGDEICCDGHILSGNIECNESMLTGESDAIYKKENDTLLSGSFVVSGKCYMMADKVGQDTYSYSILKHAKRFKRYPSQLRDSIDTIIKWCTYILIPLGCALFIKQLIKTNYTTATLNTVAAVVGMIPEGLVFLTSVALAISSFKLAKQDVLVQELYCIETLARTDTLCLDKTGTLTQGKLSVCHVEALEKVDGIIGDMMQALPDDNATAVALRTYFNKQNHNKVISFVPFSSQRKYSSVTFEDGEYKLGAYSYIAKNKSIRVEKQIEEYTKQAMRVVVLMKNDFVLAYICLRDELRPDAKDTLNFFKKQGVDIKLISGDDPKTVQALAKKAGFESESIDMSCVQDVESVVDSYSIFGRVTPEQKKELVLALKKRNKTVAMTGDGVNDVMALKEADCSIAMGSGSQACKSVASLVLLENQMNALPVILYQGRCVINNIQRTASLFLVKTLFSIGLSLLTLVCLKNYPFKPIQLTLISALATGIPSFILTLEPNGSIVKGDFLKNVFSKAIPGAVCVILSVIGVSIVGHFVPVSSSQYSTMCTILAGVNALVVLIRVCVPMTTLRKTLVVVMCSIFLCAMVLFKHFFYIVNLTWYQVVYVVINICLIPYILNVVSFWVKYKIRNFK
ncbi:HAD family hydrolase [Eubacterium sp. AF22-8LB]|uniref:HAD-IC family P-type ATPase n=1 Tax=Eubacterium sp. AF22-8LB TaxID=2292232 RepID=UPI000E487D12|nr:HAD-IC family P-type ATPase [Eubacterium sp. AF22-8LB]RGS31464.1 HAD family hydrolase [Eubacterium sp. AF22-8LB]